MKKLWLNIKNKTVYEFVAVVLDATNNKDDAKRSMILYKNKDGQLYVRDVLEFYEKFKELSE